MATQDFTLDLDAFVAKAKGRMNEFLIEFLQDLNEQVVRATPVDTGFLRGSWFASIGAPSVSGGALDPAGAGAVARMNLVASGIVVGQAYYAMNGAAYAARVEYGFVGKDKLGRQFNQPPRAFVRSTMARAQIIAEAAAVRVAST